MGSVHNLLDFKANSELFKSCKWGIWGQFRTIKNNWGEITSLVDKGFVSRVGNGESIRFWEDVWIGVSPLKSCYPRLYSASIQKNWRIVDIGA